MSKFTKKCLAIRTLSDIASEALKNVIIVCNINHWLNLIMTCFLFSHTRDLHARIGETECKKGARYVLDAR